MKREDTLKIETERLVIRHFSGEDWRDLYEYLSDPEVVRFEPYEIFSEEKCRYEAERRSSDPDFWAVCLKDGGKLIGNLYLSGREYDEFELGYVLNRAFQGQGYATEGARALLAHAVADFGARRLVAMCNPDNNRSWQLLDRLGFAREGHLKRNIYFKTDSEGEPVWLDTYLYGVLAEEWQPHRSHVEQGRQT